MVANFNLLKFAFFGQGSVRASISLNLPKCWGNEAVCPGQRQAGRLTSTFPVPAGGPGISKNFRMAGATRAWSRRTKLLIIITPGDELSKGKFWEKRTAKNGKAPSPTSKHQRILQNRTMLWFDPFSRPQTQRLSPYIRLYPPIEIMNAAPKGKIGRLPKAIPRAGDFRLLQRAQVCFLSPPPFFRSL